MFMLSPKVEEEDLSSAKGMETSTHDMHWDPVLPMTSPDDDASNLVPSGNLDGQAVNVSNQRSTLLPWMQHTEIDRLFR